jgi:hypothetical protein
MAKSTGSSIVGGIASLAFFVSLVIVVAHTWFGATFSGTIMALAWAVLAITGIGLLIAIVIIVIVVLAVRH